MAVENEFAPVAVLLLVATGLTLAIMVLAHVIGPKRRGPIKDATYESGMEPVGDARRRFNVRFYLVAVMFLVFDVEIVFLYPWAMLYPRLQGQGADAAYAAALRHAGYGPGFFLVAFAIFFAVLLVGFVFEWRKGLFRWD